MRSIKEELEAELGRNEDVLFRAKTVKDVRFFQGRRQGLEFAISLVDRKVDEVLEKAANRKAE
jgi:hypothetical protein